MDTEVQPPVDEELHLLTSWGEPGDRSRTGTAGVLSLVVHALVIGGLMVLPSNFLAPPREVPRQVTPLVEPPLTELTQPTPNKAKIQKDFTAASPTSQATPRVAPSPPPAPRASLPKTLPLPPAPAPSAPAPSLPEPPKVEEAHEAPKAALPLPVVQPPPQIQAQEAKPKSPFETPGSQPPVQGAGRIAVPSASVSDAIRSAARGGGSGIAVGDTGAALGGMGAGSAGLPPSPGRLGSNLELLSDEKGVDFRPFLIKVLAAVRRNWHAVMPEAARMGRRGRVSIVFSVARNGSVPKLVIEASSGTDALDRAAVVGISASNPFPPLPPEYKSDRVTLRLNFSYNMPNQ